MEQFRWYYNSTLNIVYNHFGHKEITKKKYFASNIRDLVRKHKYVEEESGRYIFSRFEYDEYRNENPVAPWWSSKPHSRISRGAVNKFVSSLNSAISNYKNKNNNGFKMKFRTKKDVLDYINFEDKGFPSMIKKIKSRYWYRTKDKKRKNISFSDIQCNDKGIEIIHDKIKDRYFLHYPVEYDWYPSDDNRNDNQVMSSSSRKQVIALDPGIRKFMVGYDPEGKYIHICNGGSELIIQKLKEIDKLDSLIEEKRCKGGIKELKEKKYLLWLKIKNMVKELHWKTIKYLTDNYDTILLPDFRVSQMVRKKDISRSTKRMLCMYSFHSFKEKLKYKCDVKNVKLVIVDESFTSKTCGFCGCLNDTRGAEYLKCIRCKKEMDRDESGSRNILLKNLSRR
jgi:IS605 OrfB family transposase